MEEYINEQDGRGKKYYGSNRNGKYKNSNKRANQNYYRFENKKLLTYNYFLCIILVSDTNTI